MTEGEKPPEQQSTSEKSTSEKSTSEPKSMTSTGTSHLTDSYLTSTSSIVSPEASTAPGNVDAKIRLDIETDQIIIDFGRLVTWVGMRPEQARLFAKILWARAQELEQQSPRAQVIRFPTPPVKPQD